MRKMKGSSSWHQRVFEVVIVSQQRRDRLKTVRLYWRFFFFVIFTFVLISPHDDVTHKFE